MDLGRGLTRGSNVRRRIERVLHGRPSVGQRPTERRQLINLLHGEGEPGLQIRIEFGLQLEVERNVEEGAGRRYDHMVRSTTRRDRLDPVEDGGQVRAPDVAAVNDAE